MAFSLLDQLSMLLVGQIIGHLKFLGESVEQLLNSSESDNFESELKRLMGVHSNLIKYSDVVNEIFGFSCMIHVVFGSITICFTGFLVVVSRMISDGLLSAY